VTAAPLEPPPTDRRARRRQESIDEILATAVAVMAEVGAGGLNLGEVARRVGVRPPSLYQYFPSKGAIYDEVFARGWRALEEHIRAFERAAGPVHSSDAARDRLCQGSVAFVRWALEHPVQSQLMFWRPVPGFRPSPDAYAPAVALVESTRRTLAGFVTAGWLRPEAAAEDALHAYTTAISGVISQQLSNQPGAGFDEGLYTRLIPLLTDMFFDHYRTSAAPRKDRP
jgi:AcrR family transcriptional regulator